MSGPPLDALGVALRVAAALEGAGVRYFLGGSLASSLQGEPRSTNDIDFVVEIGPWHVARFVAALGADFVVDEGALQDAIRHRGSMNLFYLPLVLKIDLFVLGDTPFDESEFARRRAIVIRADGATLWIKSPEDTVLRKLLWFIAGGSVSERQWRDVVAVLRVGGPRLDVRYLDAWAARLGVTSLLDRARAEASPPPA